MQPSDRGPLHRNLLSILDRPGSELKYCISELGVFCFKSDRSTLELNNCASEPDLSSPKLDNLSSKLDRSSFLLEFPSSEGDRPSFEQQICCFCLEGWSRKDDRLSFPLHSLSSEQDALQAKLQQSRGPPSALHMLSTTGEIVLGKPFLLGKDFVDASLFEVCQPCNCCFSGAHPS